MRGRKSALRVIEGGANPSRCPAPPSWLSIESKREWKRTAPQLHGRNLLTPETTATFESYCVAVGQIRQCQDIIAAEGLLVTTEDGAKPHQAFRVQQAAMREARLLAAELALTPHRRNHGAAETEGKGDGWSDLLA